LHVQPGGSKLWRLKYRFDDKEKLLSFGPYPLTTIAEARAKRDEAKKLLAAGRDPSVQKMLDRIAATTALRNTFGLVAEEYLANLKDRDLAKATISKNRWLLVDLASSLSKRAIADITSAEILDLVRKVEKSGRRETAHKLRGVISSVFRLAIVTLRAQTDPTAALRGALLPPRRQGRSAILDEKEFGALLNTLDAYTGWPTISAAMKFQILTCARPGEVRGAMQREVDRKKAIWHVPAERMKMRREHDVPLSRQALQVLDDISPYSDEEGLLFPSIRSKRQQLSENAFNSALRRMGYAKDEATSHGFRATASSVLNERGFDPDVIEAVLAHQDQNSVRRAYNRSTYWDQRMRLMQEWADLLDQFRRS
jgi:integrase